MQKSVVRAPFCCMDRPHKPQNDAHTGIFAHVVVAICINLLAHLIETTGKDPSRLESQQQLQSPKIEPATELATEPATDPATESATEPA